MSVDPRDKRKSDHAGVAVGEAKVVRLDPTWRRHLQRGLRRLRAGDHPAASDAFSRALCDAPDEPELLLAAGRAYLGLQRYAEAEEALRGALERQPASLAAAALLARVLGLHRDRREEAFTVLHRSLELLRERDGHHAPEGHTPEAAALHVVRGELLLDEGAISDARAAFGLALDHDTTDAAARAGVARSFNAEGILLSDEGDSERAAFCFKRAADLDPRWSGPLVNLGVVFGRLGRLDRALEAYTEALTREPANPVACFNLATTHQELGHREESVACFEELLELCPDYPQARMALANALADRNDSEQDDLDQAIALLLEELELDEDSVAAWTSLGLAYLCHGSPERGEQCLQRALALDPSYFNAYYNLAVLYVAEQRLEEAEDTIRQAFARQPGLTARLLASDPQFDQLRCLPGLQQLLEEPPQ